MKKIAILLGIVTSALVLASCAHQGCKTGCATQAVADNNGSYNQPVENHAAHRDYKGEQQ